MMNEILKRLKDPIFDLAMASLVYQILIKFGVVVDQSLYQNIIDLVSMVFLGTGIYKSFGAQPVQSTTQEPNV